MKTENSLKIEDNLKIKRLQDSETLLKSLWIPEDFKDKPKIQSWEQATEPSRQIHIREQTAKLSRRICTWERKNQRNILEIVHRHFIQINTKHNFIPRIKFLCWNFMWIDSLKHYLYYNNEKGKF